MPELQANGSVVNHGSSILENTTGMSVYAILNKNVIEILNRPIAAVSEGKRIYFSMDIRGEGAARKLFGKPIKAFEKIDTELVDHVRGRILAYGFVPDKKEFVDLNLADLRYVVDFYRSMYDKEMRDKIMRSSSDMVTGVDCVGDLAVHNELPYHSVDISMSEMVSGEWDCPAAEKIGIPIIVKRLEPSLTWRGRKFDGGHAAYNMIHCQLTTRNTFDCSLFKGRTIQERDDLVLDQGTILVVRQDKKPMHIEHAKVMADYFHDRLEEYQSECRKDGTLGEIGTYLAMLSKEDFISWYPGWVKKQQMRMPWFEKGPSPYEV